MLVWKILDCYIISLITIFFSLNNLGDINIDIIVRAIVVGSITTSVLCLILKNKYYYIRFILYPLVSLMILQQDLTFECYIGMYIPGAIIVLWGTLIHYLWEEAGNHNVSEVNTPFDEPDNDNEYKKYYEYECDEIRREYAQLKERRSWLLRQIDFKESEIREVRYWEKSRYYDRIPVWQAEVREYRSEIDDIESRLSELDNNLNHYTNLQDLRNAIG